LVPAPFQVVLDANVLFPFTLRDTLLRAAEQELYLPGWSKDILEEMRRNLVKTGHTTEEKSHRLVAQMKRAFPEAEITGYEYLVPSMPNDTKDRHVVAAAVRTGSQLVVTDNLRDFRTLPEGLEAKSPDSFLCDLLDLSRDQMVRAIIDQAAALKKPPRTVDDVLRGLQNSAPTFVQSVRLLL
jgi:hypothetical protein